MSMTASKKNRRNARQKSTTSEQILVASPVDMKRGWLKWVLFSILAVGSFSVTYTLTKLNRNSTTAPLDNPPGMVWILGGEFTMGTDSTLGWADEKPAHQVRVRGFWIDETDVTNAQFRKFVEATNYVTTAEKPLDEAEILRQSPPGTPPPAKEMLQPGSRHETTVVERRHFPIARPGETG